MQELKNNKLQHFIFKIHILVGSHCETFTSVESENNYSTKQWLISGIAFV